MDKKLYPPCVKVVVQAKDRFFFESSKYVNYQLTCGTEIISGKLTVPSFGKTIINIKYKSMNVPNSSNNS